MDIQAPGLTDPLFTEAQAAEMIGVEPATLQVWRSTKRYPLPYVKAGRLVRYRRSAIEEFLRARTVADGATPLLPARVKPSVERTSSSVPREVGELLTVIAALRAAGLNSLDDLARAVSSSVPTKANSGPAKATTAPEQAQATTGVRKRREAAAT